MTRETSSQDDNNRNNNSGPEEPATRLTTDQNDNHSSIPVVVVVDDRTTTTVRYLGAFTEKLFRSKSQPSLAIRRALQIVVNRDDTSGRHTETTDSSDDSDLTLPFADTFSNSQHVFSPVRALRAPIIEFKDI